MEQVHSLGAFQDQNLLLDKQAQPWLVEMDTNQEMEVHGSLWFLGSHILFNMALREFSHLTNQFVVHKVERFAKTI